MFSFSATASRLEGSLSGRPDTILTAILLAIAVAVILIALFAPRLVKLAAIPYLLLP